jgi:hypothetical protein
MAGSTVAAPRASGEPGLAVAVHAAYFELGGAPLWPGFAPRQTPLAIHDGERTWLFGHPSPPASFTAVESIPGTCVRDGRAPEVVSNTSVMLAGVSTGVRATFTGARIEQHADEIVVQLPR